jgi:hypothetical protein
MGPGSAAHRCALRRVRGKGKFLLTLTSASRLICPSCQCAAGNFACGDGQIAGRFLPVPRSSRGALRGRHERWARDAMDAWMGEDDAHRCGRRSRVVLMPRRWHQVGGIIRWRWWQENPITRESAKKAVKPSRRECRLIRRTCSDYSCVLFSLHTRLRVRPRIRHSRRPPFFGAPRSDNPGS